MKLPEPIAILQIGEHENGGEIRVAELELSAYSLPAGTKLYAIPEGWTLAPLQPTPEMKEAALPAFEQRAYTHLGMGLEDAYCAMLDAVPLLPTEQ